MKSTIRESNINLRDILIENDELTEKGRTVWDILMTFEDLFSSDAIDAAAKKIGVNPVKLTEFFLDDENSEWRDTILDDHQRQITSVADDLERLQFDFDACNEWKLKKALTILENKKNAEQKKLKEYHKMVDDFSEKLKKHFGVSDKQMSGEFKAVMEFRKKTSNCV